MRAQLRPALVALGLFTLLTGLVYPLVVTGIAQVVFPWQANGSLIVQRGQPVGSALLGQPFDDPKYFWGRPSATSPAYNAASSSGSNLGPTNKVLIDTVANRVKALHEVDSNNTASIPVDLVTASGSGIDPHVSPAAALYQINRIAKSRGLKEEKVREIVQYFTEDRPFGLFGQPRINVLQLNLALDDYEKHPDMKFDKKDDSLSGPNRQLTTKVSIY